MFDESMRNAIALKRFSMISPVINGQVKNHMAYYIEITEKPIDMPHYGTRKYAPKTIEAWYCDYMRGGIDALKPGYRGDRGNCRKINPDIGEKILEKKKMHPKAPDTIIYEMLIKEGVFTAGEVSLSTIYRFLKSSSLKGIDISGEEKKDMKRFSHQYVGELWQTDLMYGPYIRNGQKKHQTYLFAYIDDASRLITHAEFYFAQNFEVLRHSFREAVLKRGIPTLIYTDNGKIYRSQQFELMCASLGSTLIHSQPFVPNGRGKIERFFLTVRKRFLSGIDPGMIKNLEELNTKFFKWLDEDYQRKPHTSLEGLSPLDFFMTQVSRVKMYRDPIMLKEKFLLRIKRKVNHDGTFSINNIIYETEARFSCMSIEIRYDPEWLNTSTPVLIYMDDKKVGEGRRVNFHDNAHMKRRGRPSELDSVNTEKAVLNSDAETEHEHKQTISFMEIMVGGN